MSRECPSIWRERYKSLSPCLFFGCESETKETCHLASTGERKRRKRKKKSSFSFHFHFIFIRRLWSLLYASDTVASRWEKDWHDFSARSETRVFFFCSIAKLKVWWRRCLRVCVWPVSLFVVTSFAALTRCSTSTRALIIFDKSIDTRNALVFKNMQHTFSRFNLFRLMMMNTYHPPLSPNSRVLQYKLGTIGETV